MLLRSLWRGLFVACLCTPQVYARAEAAPPPQPCQMARVLASYPMVDSKPVPTDIRLYVLVRDDNTCTTWDSSKLTLTSEDGSAPRQVEGTHTVTQIGTYSGKARLFIFIPKAPLPAETQFKMTFTLPDGGNFGQATKEVNFATGKEPAIKRSPSASFVFNAASFTPKSPAQCVLGMSFQKADTSPGDLVFLHLFSKTTGKAVEKPFGVIAGSKLLTNTTSFSFVGSGSDCNQDEMCVQLHTQSENGIPSVLQEHCTTVKLQKEPPPTGCQASPHPTKLWLALLCVLWVGALRLRSQKG